MNCAIGLPQCTFAHLVFNSIFQTGINYPPTNAPDMSVLTNIDDVEQVASAWLARRYGKKLGKVKFVEVMG